MAKQKWKGAALLNPVPAVMVTSSDGKGKDNIITVAWAGTVNTQPPMISISVRKERFSYELIKNKGEFVVNLVTKKLVRAVDYCGVKSGSKVDKFEELKLTKEKAQQVDVPLIAQSPVNIECVVRECLELGSHDMFIGNVVAVNVDDELLDDKGKLDLKKAGLICYSHGEYFALEKALGFFGFSVAKRKIKR